jgi:hypothetical protein
MKKRDFLTSVTLLAAAMSSSASIDVPAFYPNKELASLVLNEQNIQKPFILQKADSNSVEMAYHSSHSSHSSHGSHSSHASSRY